MYYFFPAKPQFAVNKVKKKNYYIPGPIFNQNDSNFA